MALRLADKKAIVAEVSDVASESISVVVAHYRGLSVAEMTELRAKARNSNVYLRVVRNTLAKRAIINTDFECIKDELLGPVVLAFSKEEPSAAARLIRDFAKEHEKLEVRALSVGGTLFAADKLEDVAKLPTYDEAISKLMSAMQAPITKLAQTLNAVPSKLVRTVVAVKDQKEAA